MSAKSGPHLERLACVAASPNGKLVAYGGERDFAGSTSSSVHVLALPKLSTAASLAVDGPVFAACFATNELLLAGTGMGELVAFDCASEPPRKIFAAGAHNGAIRAIAAHPLGKLIASAGDDGRVVLHNVAEPSFTKLAELNLSARPLHALAIDSAGNYLAAAGEDGIIRSIALPPAARPAIREMPAGEGGIRSLAFLADGRLAAGCGDGSIRFVFLEGEVDEEKRSADAGHDGPVRALVLGPQLYDDADKELPRVLYSAGEDAGLKTWAPDTKRRPKTIAVGHGELRAMCFVPPRSKKEAGRLALVTRARKLIVLPIGAEGEVEEDETVLDSELDRLDRDLGASGAAAREAAIRALLHLPEDEARVLLERALDEDRTVELRILAIEMIAASDRRRSRPALRRAIGEGGAYEPFSKPAANKELRTAALKALIQIDAGTPLDPLRRALASAHEEIRLEALERLPALRASSPLVPGMIAGRLSDRSPEVRAKALDATEKLEPKGSIEPYRTAIARGAADVRAEALIRLALAGKSRDAAGKELVERALDDEDAHVRSVAFSIAIAADPGLSDRLRKAWPKVQESLAELEKRGRIPGSARVEGDAALEPLFAALACRSPDTALRGARGLALLGDGRASGALLQLSREADREIRKAVVEALVAATIAMPHDDRLRGRLEWLLDDPEKDVRANAFEALSSLAKKGDELELAELALRATFEDIRTRALTIAVGVGPKHAQAERSEKIVVDALDDEAPRVRSEAFRTLWSWHASSGTELALERAAKSRHGDIREKVVAEAARQKGAWVRPLLLGLVEDAAAPVGLAAYQALTKTEADKKKSDVHLAAMRSLRPEVRAAGAKGARDAKADEVRSVLSALVQDDRPEVHTAAIEAIDHLLPNDQVAFAHAFGSIFYALRVRAGELCGKRRDARAIDPMRELLAIPEHHIQRPADELRKRAARAIADVGAPQAIPFYVSMLDDADGVVREMGARGLATACRPGREAPLVSALGHADLSVRSWAAEGLARLGDLRSLPVLAGTQLHEHRPIRIGAILGFVALGADGVRGILQGLADPDREIQDLVFAIIVARDRALHREGHGPDLLLSALSSSHPEIRFAAARTLEARASGAYDDRWAEELVGPKKPEKAGDLKSWPAEDQRAAYLGAVVNALASDDPTHRYASAQVLALRSQPEAFWREASALARPERADRPRVPHTSFAEEPRLARKQGWIRRLFQKSAPIPAGESWTRRVLEIIEHAGAPIALPVPASSDENAAAKRLAFGTYAGLVRQAPASGEADETHRLRRDSLERLAALAGDAAIGREVVLPIVRRALSDPHHLVRRASLAALEKLYEPGALAPLGMALESAAADIGRAAVDALIARAAGGDRVAGQLAQRAIDAPSSDVRLYAAGALERLFAKGSIEPFLIALSSRHSDVRSSVVDRLVDSEDARVLEALARAMESDHEDLRLRAATALVRRGDPRTVEVLAPFARSEDRATAGAAVEALVTLAKRGDQRARALAAEAIAQRIEDDPDKTADRAMLIGALARIGDRAGGAVLIALLADEAAAIREAAFEALLTISKKTTEQRRFADGSVRPVYDEALALEYLGAAARSAEVSLRLAAARAADAIELAAVEALLAKLIGDRDETVRIAACESLAFRAEHFASASLEPLADVLRAGRRELVLPAALGLAGKRRAEAFQPLLLVFAAGEQPERMRALLALGTLGDRRALETIEPLLDPTAELSDEDRALAPQAVEAMGRMLARLAGDERNRVRDRVESIAREGGGALRFGALAGLRAAGDDRSRALLEQIAGDRHEDGAARVVAVRELGALGRAESEIVLAEALDDDDDAVRTEAVSALARVFPSEPTRTSLLALSSRHEDVNEPAASFLSRRGDPETLVRRMGEISSETVRKRLRRGLARRGAFPRAAIEALLAADAAGARSAAAALAGASAAGEGAAGARSAAAAGSGVPGAAAGASAARELGAAIGAAVAKASSSFAAKKARVASKRDEQGAEELALEASAWASALWAARALGADARESARAVLGGVRGEPARGAGASDSSARAGESRGAGSTGAASGLAANVAAAVPAEVRREAIRYLAGGGRAEDAAVVEGSLGDADAGVRRAAAEAIARLEPARAAARAMSVAAPDVGVFGPELAHTVASGGASFADVRARLIAVPAVLAARDVVRAAEVAGSKKQDAAARVAAIQVLGRIGGGEALRVIEAILADRGEAEEIRAAAFRALKRIQRAAKTWPEGQDKEKRGAAGGGGGYSGGGGDDGDSDDEPDEDSDDEYSDDDDSDGDSDDEYSDDDDGGGDDDESSDDEGGDDDDSGGDDEEYSDDDDGGDDDDEGSDDDD